MEVREGMSSVVLAVGPGHSLREAADEDDREGNRRRAGLRRRVPGPRIITERDVLFAVGTGVDPDKAKVAEHMSDSVISAPPDWSLERAAEEMVKLGIRHLVVVEAASWSASSRCATSSASGRRSARRRRSTLPRAALDTRRPFRRPRRPMVRCAQGLG